MDPEHVIQTVDEHAFKSTGKSSGRGNVFKNKGNAGMMKPNRA